MTIHRRTTCRACGSETLESVLNLGMQPLANALPSEAGGREPVFPLELFLCTACGLAQLADVVDPSILFSQYLYVSGTSPAMGRHWKELATTTARIAGLSDGDRVIEIASNDGTLLAQFQELGARVMGVEPAENIVQIARENGIPTHHGFFNSATAHEIQDSFGSARIVTANNVLAHVDEPLEFLRSAASLLDEGGILVTEVPLASHLIRDVEYDTIYHEHLCYFSLSPLLTLFKRAGLGICEAVHQSVHGGTLRLIAKRDTDHDAAVQAEAAKEQEEGLLSPKAWHHLAERVAENRVALVELLQSLRDAGSKVWGYGAPAKASTLLNYCGIGSDLLVATADRSPLKVGRYIPGVQVPIRTVDELLEDAPDYVLILAWNLAAEIRAQLAPLREQGTRFVVPHPTPGELDS